MNNILKQLLDTGDIIRKRTLHFIVEGEPTAFTTEYTMNGTLGPFKWYVTWKDENCKTNREFKWRQASIFIHDARARLYFPPYLDTRIPPKNREGLEEILERFHVPVYDKFDLIVATKAKSPIKAGYVEEIEPIDCDFEEIHAIEEIWDEYERTLI